MADLAMVIYDAHLGDAGNQHLKAMPVFLCRLAECARLQVHEASTPRGGTGQDTGRNNSSAGAGYCDDSRITCSAHGP